jgi:hypothetical protein
MAKRFVPDPMAEKYFKGDITRKRKKKTKKFVKELNKVVKWQSDAYDTGKVDELRKAPEESYDLVEIEYNFGKRLCYVQKNQEDYELLQGARGGATPLIGDWDYSEDTEKLMRAAYKNIHDINYRDEVRIGELEDVSTRSDIPYFNLANINSFCELGYRTPRLLQFYENKDYGNDGMTSKGYDVLELNIIVGKHFGFDVGVFDFNDCDGPNELNLSETDLVVSYHMLEHLSDPLTAVKKIYNSMKRGAFFHVEIPVEYGVPSIRYGHMYAFHKDDLGHMLSEAGFELLTLSRKVHTGGPPIERRLAMKL